MNKSEFSSSYANYFSSFLNNKRNRGYICNTMYRHLLRFDTYLNMNCSNKQYITEEDCQGFIRELSRTNNNKSIRDIICTISQFSKYLCELGIESYVPRVPKREKSGYQAYIFTNKEIEDLFSAADNYILSRRLHPSVMFIMPALLRTLYSTGMRINEALSIKNKDVKFDKHVFVLNKTKNGHQRVAPINNSLEVVLKQYLVYRNKIKIPDIEASDKPFFVNTLGKSPNSGVVYSAFRQLLRIANIKYLGNHKGPHLHSIRHTACIHAMQKLIDSGMDMYCCIPILSTFIGHKQVSDTQQYIRLTQEVFPSILEKDRSINRSIANVIAYAIINSENDEE